jgi:3-oxoacyl-(acyl-carrier-protein) synthase
MSIVVTGVGVVSALGPNPAAFRRALLDGVNACAMREFPRFDGRVVKAPAYVAVPAEPEGLIEPKKLRRMFRLARMSAVAARQALKHAELDPAAMDPARLGICFGTSFGAMEPTQRLVDSWIENGEQNASPLQFTNSVHGIMASHIALDINARGVNLTTAQRDICFEAALDTAVQLLEARRADVILVGGGDELTPMLHEFGSSMYQLVLSSVDGLDPWGSTRAIVPGDGAAVVVLERDDTPRRALASVAATRVGRCDQGGVNVAMQAWEAAGKPKLELVTNDRDGGARCARLNDKQEAELGWKTPAISHRGNFGTYPSAGAQQFVANVLMLCNGEYYEPLADGKPTGRRAGSPKTILHNAPSISGGHAAYVLTK